MGELLFQHERLGGGVRGCLWFGGLYYTRVELESLIVSLDVSAGFGRVFRVVVIPQRVFFETNSIGTGRGSAAWE